MVVGKCCGREILKKPLVILLIMSGIDYDGLSKHSLETKERERKKFDDLHEASETKSEEGFFDVLSKRETSDGLDLALLYNLSVPQEYADSFSDTYHSFVKNAPKKLRINHVISFTNQLRVHQIKFFGEGEEYKNNRERFVKVGYELSVVDSMGSNFGASIGNYAILLGQVEDAKLDMYVQRVLRARELNCNFVQPVSKGLVAILQNLSLPDANLFTSEAFELLKVEETGCTPGLSEASGYITLKTDVARKRFIELAEGNT